MRTWTRVKFWQILLGLLFILVIPVFLNYVLQIHIEANVIGNEETWLNFWAVYIGAILTALMVLASYVTIDKTIKLNLSQRKLDWLNEYRNVSASLLIDASPNTLGIMLQKLSFVNDVSSIMEQSVEMRHKIEKDQYLLLNLFKGNETLFSESYPTFDEYIKVINKKLQITIDVLNEIAQFLIIYDFLICGDQYPDALDHIKRMKQTMYEKGFYAIVEMIGSLDKYQSYQEIPSEHLNKIKMSFSKAMTMQSSNIPYEELKSYLLEITKKESNNIHGNAFMSYSHPYKS